MPPGADAPAPPRRPLVVALALYLTVVAWITLQPTNPEREFSLLLGWAVEALVGAGVDERAATVVLEALANVVMFVPYGVLLALLLPRRRWWAAVVVPAATSVAIETVQLLLPDRFPTVQDVVMNSLGAAVGLACMALWARWTRWTASRRTPAG